MKFRPKFSDPRFIPALGRDVDSSGTFEATGAVAESFESQTDLYTRVDKPQRRGDAKPRKARKARPSSRATPPTPPAPAEPGPTTASTSTAPTTATDAAPETQE